jgi:transcriptional regulator with XRE-family HTH domain
MDNESRPHIKIAERLRAFRELLGMGQKEFAEQHGFNKTQYTNWENGIRRIPIDQAAKLEDQYGLTLDFIYLGRVRTLPHNLVIALSDKPSDSQNNMDSDMPSS